VNNQRFNPCKPGEKDRHFDSMGLQAPSSSWLSYSRHKNEVKQPTISFLANLCFRHRPIPRC
jgi:hypothetical protein